MAFNWQRSIDIKVAASSRKQATIGTALTDALIDEAMRMLEATVPIESREFRSDRNWIKGDEDAATLDVRRKDIRWSPSFDANSWNLAWALAFLLGKVASVVTDTSAFTHTIERTAPPTDQPILPVTTISVKDTADLNAKYVDLVLQSLTISGANNAAGLGLATQWIGSGVTAAAVASYPALVSPEVGPLFNSDMKISLGTEGSPTEISERIQEWSIQGTNNFLEGLAYYPGSGQVRARFPHGSRDFTITLGVFAKDVDDILTLFQGSTSKELKFVCEGGLAGATTANHKFQMRFPAVRFTAVEKGDDSGFRLHRISIAPEGIFKGATLVKPYEVQIVNKEATYLATS